MAGRTPRSNATMETVTLLQVRVTGTHALADTLGPAFVAWWRRLVAASERTLEQAGGSLLESDASDVLGSRLVFCFRASVARPQDLFDLARTLRRRLVELVMGPDGAPRTRPRVHLGLVQGDCVVAWEGQRLRSALGTTRNRLSHLLDRAPPDGDAILADRSLLHGRDADGLTDLGEDAFLLEP